ncbi:MAG: site-2 protease family protein [Euryarchaeota archaeon]|nr:site-2 protease family protein [Euryarchaeota archaeon]MDE1879967.1 site-2 protease family protein [Euryarchaeota archaeon]
MTIDLSYVMDVILPYVIVPLVAYIAVLFVLDRKGWLGKDKPLALLGPILMVKTLHGRKLLERLSRYRRSWNLFGDLGIVLAFVGMVVMFAFLLWGAYRSSVPSTAVKAPLNEVVTIPGLNPLLPIGYGLLALVVAVVLHEFCHGILARANDIRVKSLGVLFLVIPLGAFVEQDDEDMMKVPARKRDRVAAAGVMANFVLAFLFFVLMAGLVASSVHVKTSGIAVLGVVSESPVSNASAALGPEGLAPGDFLTELNGSATPDYRHFQLALWETHPGETVSVQWYSESRGGHVSTNVTLGAAVHWYDVTKLNASQIRSLTTLSFLGFEPASVPPSVLLGVLAKGPAATGTGASLNTSDVVASSALFLALPITSEMPLQGASAQFYTVDGPLGALGAGNVWVVINTLYWLVWVNLLLGIFNALPAVPLDGGFLFRDVATGAVRRLRPAWTQGKTEKAVNVMSIFATLLVFFLILWELVAPYLLNP